MISRGRARGLGWVHRGDARLLVLEVLRGKPMHGYEVGKAISLLFGGVYEPSPGVVYPNLQWLEDEGMVESNQVWGRKVYRVTEAGKRFASEGAGELNRLLDAGRVASKGSKWQLMKEARSFTEMIMFAYPELTEEKAESAALILKEARQKTAKVLER